MKYSIACLNMILLLQNVYDFGLNGFLQEKAMICQPSLKL